MELRTNTKQKKSISTKIRAIVLIVMIGIITWKGLEFNKTYNNPLIIGKWISNETGKEVEFTQDGMVNVDKIKAGDYIISSPNLLVYDIEGYTFEMNYKINQRSLVWGIPGAEEKFERKGL